MLFSSFTFLFFFFPLTCLLYFLLPVKFRNPFLLIASLVFYGFGEPLFLFCMLLSILWNYLFGLLIGKTGKKLPLIIGVAGNLCLLFYFKYLNFAVEIVSPLFIKAGINGFTWNKIALPIGISFFTFQGLSYLIDVHRDRTLVQKNPMLVALYIALFPQLIAGPIIRWESIRLELVERTSSLSDIAAGVKLFLYGLAAKVIIANSAGRVADQVFNTSPGTLSAGAAWFGITAYTLQIYFDFSGYSNMAIGIGRIFGFHFPVNFNYPYCASSISDFWRRWHISLSQWFRDYVYIPLGGSRCGTGRIMFNILVVFTLTGIWHGANWTFLVWGLWYGVLLCIEKTAAGKLPGTFCWRIFTLSAVMIGWVFFRSDTLSEAIHFLKAMTGGNGGAIHPVPDLFTIKNIFFVVVGCGLVSPWYKFITEKKYVGEILSLILLLLSIMMLARNAYNPFLYFRF